ncbi:hypothetical protein [Sphingomonas sp.]|uniref:structural cement protein Gp24 n=1 Tax=Sphingomonas sp. TaxID=28214 RepID=UPI0035C7CF21
MAIYQDTYLDTLPVGYPGMVANGETSNRISRTIKDAGGIGFGKAVFEGTDEHSCSATGNAAAFLGISIAHEALAPIVGGTPDVFPQNANVPIMTLGVIWVLAAASVTKRDLVYVTSAGAFTNSSSNNTLLAGWVFDTTAASGGLVKIAKR